MRTEKKENTKQPEKVRYSVQPQKRNALHIFTEKKRTAYINVRAREMLRAALFSPKRENGTEKDNHPANRLRATIFCFDAPQNVARELFRFGSGSKKFSRHEEKILIRLFPKTRAAIRAIMVRENQIGIYPPKSERGSYEALPTASIATITTAISEVVRAKKSKQ